MIEPVSALSTLSSGLTATVTAANFVFALQNTPKDVRACAQLVTRVYDDLQYLVTLRNAQQEYLRNAPFECQRVDGIIAEASKSLLAIGSKLEACRAEANGGKVPWMGRMKWVLGDSASFVLHSRNLGVQQAAINTEIGWLRSLKKETVVDRVGITNGGEVFENLELLRLSSKKSTIFRETPSAVHSPPPPPYEGNTMSWNDSMVGEGTGDAEFDINQEHWDFYLDPARSSTSMNPPPNPTSSTVYPRRPISVNRGNFERGSKSFLQAQPNNRRASLQQLRLEPSNPTNSLMNDRLRHEGRDVDVEYGLQQQHARSFKQPRPESRYTASSFDDDEVANLYDTEVLSPHHTHRTSASISSPVFVSFWGSPTFPTSTQDPYKELDLPNQGSFNYQNPLPPPRPPKTPSPRTPIPSDIINRANPYPNSNLSWLPDSAEWFPNTETSSQVPYLAKSIPVPLQVPQEEGQPDFSDEKISVTYTPFSYKSAPWSDILPEASSSTPKMSSMAVEDDDKMTISSLDDEYPTAFYSMNDYEERSAEAYSSYISTSNISSTRPETMTYSSYAPTPVSFAERDCVSRSYVTISDTGQAQDDRSKDFREEEMSRQEDTHDAFFRDLKLQETEKRKRMVARDGGNGWRNR